MRVEAFLKTNDKITGKISNILLIRPEPSATNRHSTDIILVKECTVIIRVL